MSSRDVATKSGVGIGSLLILAVGGQVCIPEVEDFPASCAVPWALRKANLKVGEVKSDIEASYGSSL